MTSFSKEAILATIVAAYATSTLITGISFLIIGHFKLGSILSFFPRHILIGCIAGLFDALNQGVGFFLFQTGFELSCGVSISPSTLGVLLGFYKLLTQT